MNYERFSDSDKDFIQKSFKKTKDITKTAKKFAKHKRRKYTDSTRRTVSALLKRLGETPELSRLEESPDFQKAKVKKIERSKKRFIITWAQNETKIHKEFFNNIQAYAKHIDAQILVIAGRYQNPTAFSNPDKVREKDNWAKELKPYLTANRHNLHKYASVLADVKTQPTATYPLTGFQGIAGEATAILGHPKLHLQSLPVLEGRPHQILLTTGAVTLPNYSDSKAGAKAKSKHKYGFTIVEKDDKEHFFVRQVEALKNGSFIDLIFSVRDGAVETIDTCRALVQGDSHNRWLDEEIQDIRLNKLCQALKPSVVIQHDVQDNDSVNHHEAKDPIKSFHRYQQGRNLVSKELKETFEFLRSYGDLPIVIVRANHDVWLDKWIVDGDWKKDIPNAKEYMEYARILLENKAPKGLLPYLIDQEFKGKIKCLDRDESFMVGGYELAHHGDMGANGSRGNIKQFSKMSTPIIVGDSHTPARVDDALQVGTSTHLRIEYNQGASSWLNCDAIIHNNNKAQHIIYINKDFTKLF